METLRPNRAPGRTLIYTLLTLVLLLSSIAVHPWPGNARLHTSVEAIAMLLCFVTGALAWVDYYTKKSSGLPLLGTADMGEADKGLESEIVESGGTEGALLRERAMLRSLIDNVPNFMYVKDTQSRFLVANLHLVRELGLNAPEELLGKTDFDFFPQHLAAGFYKDEQTVIRSGQPLLNREEMSIDGQGNATHLLTTKVPLRDKDGRVTGIAGVGVDITARRRVEEELRDSRELFMLLLDSIPEGVYGIDMGG